MSDVHPFAHLQGHDPAAEDALTADPAGEVDAIQAQAEQDLAAVQAKTKK